MTPTSYLELINTFKSLLAIKRKEVKGQKDTTVIIKSTHHGPIISGVHKLLKQENVI